MRAVTLALPVATVRGLLPHGLSLGTQHVTGFGLHPVVVMFNEMLRVHLSFPSLMPSLSYRELSLGIPHCYVRAPAHHADRGPYYYQPRLFLDDLLATVGGVGFWGFPKRMASFALDNESFSVISGRGTTITSLRFRAAGQPRPMHGCAHFQRIRELHDQPLVLRMPAGEGPWFVCANFFKRWGAGSVTPLETVTEVFESYVPGLPTGAFRAQGLETTTLGSYEMRVPWRLSMPYAPALAGLMCEA